MDENLRKAWTDVVIADELDAHLDDLGQAKVNAGIVYKMISDFPLPEKSRILMPGCGTGQIFDYLSPGILSYYTWSFTDINQSFINKLSERLCGFKLKDFSCYIDDIESTLLSEEFDGVIPVLVLEQLDWKKGIKTITEYNPRYIYLIIQEQSQNAETITVNVQSRDSIRRLSEMANPQLVPREQLILFMKGLFLKIKPCLV